MATTAVPSPPPNTSESKSARKKKAKADAAAANGNVPAPVLPDVAAKEDSSLGSKEVGENGQFEHPYIRELTKNIRNVHKKMSGMQKTESIIAENPGVSLDDLVKERKLNADQKSSISKKPQLEAQLHALEEQIAQYKKLDADYQSRMQKQKDDLTSAHEKEMEKAREDGKVLGVTDSAAELRKKLLIFSQFLRCAAAKRATEEETETEESRAFEGALLLVYGGDDKAVEAAMALIEGSDERVVSIEGLPLDFKYSQIKQASVTHAPFQTEEQWVDSVAEANAATEGATVSIPPGSDPTITHAGLTELDTGAPQANGVHGVGGEDPLSSPPQATGADASGNAAGEKWDPAGAAGAGLERSTLTEEDYEIVPRPSEEVDIPSGAEATLSWADDHPQPLAPVSSGPASGNKAGERWDMKTAGEQSADAWNGADVAAQGGAQGNLGDTAAARAGEDADGFHQVPGRHNRGRGRGGRGFDGEFRGRGGGRGRGEGRGGFRGDGEGRGGRGGRGGFRGRGEGGEFRGRGGGRGRGPRGGAEGQARE